MSEAAASTAAFRTAQAPAPAAPATPAAPGDSSHVSDSHEASLFATYEADQSHPYAADYFGVPVVWDQEPSMARDLQEIEGYVREQVTTGKVENSVKAATEFMKELERKAGLSRYESSNQRITKLLAYIDFRRTVDG